MSIAYVDGIISCKRQSFNRSNTGTHTEYGRLSQDWVSSLVQACQRKTSFHDRDDGNKHTSAFLSPQQTRSQSTIWHTITTRTQLIEQEDTHEDIQELLQLRLARDFWL